MKSWIRVTISQLTALALVLGLSQQVFADGITIFKARLPFAQTVYAQQTLETVQIFGEVHVRLRLPGEPHLARLHVNFADTFGIGMTSGVLYRVKPLSELPGEPVTYNPDLRTYRGTVAWTLKAHGVGAIPGEPFLNAIDFIPEAAGSWSAIIQPTTTPPPHP